MFCPNCGKEYSQDHNFCRYCGYDLKLNMPRNAAQYTSNNNKSNDSQNDNKNDNKQILENEEKEGYTTKLTDKKNRLTPKSIAIMTIISVVVVFVFSILWSVDIATQINPNATEEETSFEIKTPTDEEPNIYAREPEVVERHDTYTEPPVIEENKIEEETDENSDRQDIQEPVREQDSQITNLEKEEPPVSNEQ